jgi:hypothetical protein
VHFVGLSVVNWLSTVHRINRMKLRTYVSETKFLVVWLDHNLNWDFHMGKLVIKLSKLCIAIKTIKSFVNKNIVKTMYFAYMH